MSDAHMVARDQLRSFIERIERLESEKKTIADDIKDVYGEAKGTGFDTKVLRKLISIRKQDRDERMEQEAILDMYMIALGMVDEPAGYDEPRQSEPVERQAAMALRSDAGLNIVTKHTEITASGGYTTASPSLATREAEESVVSNSPETATECAAPEKDAAVDERSVEADGGAALVRTLPDQNDEGGRDAQQDPYVIDDSRRHFLSDGEQVSEHLNEGGDHEVATGSAMRAGLADPTSNTGEGTALSALPIKPKFVLRPHCKNPGETCPGHGTTHCRACLKALEEEAA